ncbi:unnamed protein product, partial [Polarella glacialis]
MEPSSELSNRNQVLTTPLCQSTGACTRLRDALVQYGFAVLKVSARDSELFRRCARRFEHTFFRALPAATKERLQHFDSSGGLKGWNRPSAAKEVFRVPENCKAALEASVWPPSLRGRRLARDAQSARRRLWQLASACLRAVPRSPAVDEPSSPSPFDIFFYANDPENLLAEDVANLSPHVDPGLLTLVPVAATPGLALRCPGAGPRGLRWCKVEEDMQLEPYRHVVVFPGVALGLLAPATVHMVYKKPGCARVSLVYELRRRPPSRRKPFFVGKTQRAVW